MQYKPKGQNNDKDLDDYFGGSRDRPKQRSDNAKNYGESRGGGRGGYDQRTTQPEYRERNRSDSDERYAPKQQEQRYGYESRRQPERNVPYSNRGNYDDREAWRNTNERDNKANYRPQTKYQDRSEVPKTQGATEYRQQPAKEPQQPAFKQASPAYQDEEDQQYYDDDIHDYEYAEGDEEGDQHSDHSDEIEHRELHDSRSSETKVLMVAEKNSIALAIAKALSSNPRSSKGRTQCYYFGGTFKGKKASFIVTATNGHIFNRDFPKEYADWESVDPFKLFQASTIKKAASKGGTIHTLERCAKDCDYLLLWLDNDREGENICFEVEDVCKPFMSPNYKALRAKFSSITSQELKTAYNAINSEPNLNQSLSVDARQIIDLKVGVAFSRFQTMFFTKKYPALKDRLITFGPCQTPTLGFCVQRHEEIQNFKPRLYYYLQAQFQSTTGFKTNAEWEGEKIWQEQKARTLLSQLKDQQYFNVTEARTTQKTKPRPIGVNTVNLLKFASSFLGLGPQQTMHMAEKLYLQGFISYPRTESTAFPKGFNTQQIIEKLQQSSLSEISKHSDKLLKSGFSAPKSGLDVGDHPPITPTVIVPSHLSGPEKGIYEYVTKMFLASHSGDCIYNHSKLKAQPPGVNISFKISGNKTIEPGFTAIATWLAIDDNSFDPQKFIIDGKVRVSSLDYRSGQTSPPDHLTESELIALMETNGIGTDASMATHINNIGERAYVKVETGRRLVPTELGLCLVQGYKKIDPDLVAPQLRSNIEKQCDQIAKGQAQFKDVVDRVIQLFEEKFIKFRSNISKMDEIFAPKSHIIKQAVEGVRGGPQRGRGRGRGGRRRGGGRGRRDPEDDGGPSDVLKEITMADLLLAQIQQPSKPKEEPKPQIQQQKQAKKNFQSKKDGDLLY